MTILCLSERSVPSGGTARYGVASMTLSGSGVAAVQFWRAVVVWPW